MQTIEIKPSETPKTDAVEEVWDHLCLPRIIWNHARELERENARLQMQIDCLIDANKRIADIYADTLDCVLKAKEAQP